MPSFDSAHPVIPDPPDRVSPVGAATDGFELGPYRLSAPLAAGSVGEVWRGVHLRLGEPVAVKVLLPAARDSWAEAAFGNEVRSAAALSHPGVVQVIDHGLVDESAAAASGGRLPAGSPFLVMELVDGRALHAFVGRLPWRELQDVLLQLLSALAHSHARGVLHRDLKPGNVLMVRQPASAPGPWRAMLTDFGLAAALDQGPGADRTVAGTPAYMAPEQLRGAWREQGPWTDLYSFACLAWTLTAGVPPFGRKRSFDEFLDAHVHLEPPALDPMVAVPEGFEALLRRLLRKAPADRWGSAADVAEALAALPAPDQGPALQPTEPPVRPAGDGAGAELELDELLDGELSTGGPQGPGLEHSTRDLPPDGPPSADPEPPPWWRGAPDRPLHPLTRAAPPASWRPGRPVPVHGLQGLGFSLFGLRPIPLVGRREERDQLWRAFVDVAARRSASAVVLRGPAGVGKSRLAGWLAERAHETCGAVGLRARHGSGGGAGGGLAGAFARHLRAEGLDRRGLRDHLRRRFDGRLDDDELRALAELLLPEGHPEAASPEVRFSSPHERWTLLLRAALRLDRADPSRPGPPPVLWLDDAHGDIEAIEFAAFAAAPERAAEAPLLVVLTVQSDALAERPAEAAALDALLAGPRAVQLPVGPLEPGAHRDLIEALVGVPGELSAKLAERTRGNPLFAVQLVGDWIERGVLVRGPDGFAVAEGALAELPPDLHAVWSARADRLLARHGPPEARALELAAALGDRVLHEEWRAVCARSRARASASLVADLERMALILPDREGFTFTHPMLRETLERRAREGGRHADHHRACASMLELRGADQRPEALERVALHLLEAGDDGDALDYLHRAAQARFEQGEMGRTLALLDARAAAVGRLGLSDADPRAAAGWPLRLQVLREQGELERAHALGERALRAAEAEGWRELHARVLLELGILDQTRGDADRALRRLGAAVAAADALGDRALEARARVELGRARFERGDIDGAAAELQAGRGLAAELRQTALIAAADWQLARLDKHAGEPAAAVARLTQALAAFEALGARAGVARCTNELGEMARLQGDLDAAELHYREALRRMEETGSEGAQIVRVNLGLVMQEHGRVRESRGVLERALQVFAQGGRRGLMGVVHASLLPCAAAEHHWPEWDLRLEVARDLLGAARLVDVDLPRVLERAAALARRAGHGARADAALGLARAQWQALGRPDQVARLDALPR
jgi:serine/threonine protein kinase/tetratricopeptide (TPR) repeat protein